MLAGWQLALLSIVLANTTAEANHEHLCLEDDYTNDLPIFIEKRTICNYETVPVLVYPIKIAPDTDLRTKFCLKGQYSANHQCHLSSSSNKPTETLIN